MTTMQEFQQLTNESNVNKMITSIEKAIKGCRLYSWIDAIIDGEFPLNDRNEVAKRYIDEGGWYGVFHQTSSENGERPGLTDFELFTPESYEKWNKYYGEDYKSKGHLFFKEEN